MKRIKNERNWHGTFLFKKWVGKQHTIENTLSIFNSVYYYLEIIADLHEKYTPYTRADG